MEKRKVNRPLLFGLLILAALLFFALYHFARGFIHCSAGFAVFFSCCGLAGLAREVLEAYQRCALTRAREEATTAAQRAQYDDVLDSLEASRERRRKQQRQQQFYDNQVRQQLFQDQIMNQQLINQSMNFMNNGMF